MRHGSFHDPARFEAEMAALFHAGWVCVGTEDRLAGPETWFVHEDWGRSVLVARDAEGRPGAFVNACRHRGTRLARPEEAQGLGRLQCPYHGWVYGCDGRLLGASQRAGLPEFRDADLGLVPLALERVGPFLFVHGHPSPPAPLAAHLGGMARVLEDLASTARSPLFEIRMEIRANWKLVVSGAIEDYHVPHVHRASLESGRGAAAEHFVGPLCHSRFEIPTRPGRLLLALTRLAGGGREPGTTLENHLVFPNLVLVRILGVVHVTRFVPLAPDLTLRVSRLYDHSPPRPPWHPVEVLRAALRPLGRRGVRRVYEEDRRIAEEVQAGTRGAPDLERGPAHRQEARVEHFLAEVERRTSLGSTP